MTSFGATQAGILAEFRELADRWRADAKWLKRYGDGNPVASTLERAADDLDAMIKTIDGNDSFVTVDEYAEIHRVSPQSVTRWIREGTLRAVVTGGGRYLIRRHEIRDKSRREDQPSTQTRANRRKHGDGVTDELASLHEPPHRRPPHKPQHWNDPNFK